MFGYKRKKKHTLHQRCRALQSTEQPPIDSALHQPSCENAWFENMEGLNIYPVRLWFVIIKTSRLIIPCTSQSGLNIVHFLCICNSICIHFYLSKADVETCSLNAYKILCIKHFRSVLHLSATAVKFIRLFQFWVIVAAGVCYFSLKYCKTSKFLKTGLKYR